MSRERDSIDDMIEKASAGKYQIPTSDEFTSRIATLYEEILAGW